MRNFSASWSAFLRRAQLTSYIGYNASGDYVGKDATRGRLLPYFALSFLFVAVVTPLVFTMETGVATARDEMLFHYPTIVSFWEQLPKLDLRNYNSATTPLYHLLMMVVAFVVGPGLLSLRFVNEAIGLLCLLVVYHILSERGVRTNAFIFTLIFMLSPYFIGPSAVLFTDNLALLFIFLSLWSLARGTIDKVGWIWANIFAMLAVLTRQIHIWLAGVALLSGVWQFEKQPNQTSQLRIKLANAIPVLLPVIALGSFVLLWGGLTPVTFLGKHESQTLLNGDAFTYIISLLGLYGGCLAIWYWRLWRQYQSRRQLIHIGILIVLGALYLLINPYPIEADADKSSGALWQLARLTPAFFSTSLVFWVLFLLGLVLLYVTVQALVVRHEYVMALSLPLWLLANLATNRIYQRYYEPFLLFAIGYVLVVLNPPASWKGWIGPAILVCGLAFMTMVRLVLPIFL